MADINIKFPLKRGSSGAFETNKTTLEAVEDDLKMLILTNHGERVIHSDFGANLRKLIFEMRGPQLQSAIEDAIVAAVEKWMPFVNILNIEVIDSTKSSVIRENEVNIKITYSVGTIDDTKILLQKIRV